MRQRKTKAGQKTDKPNPFGSFGPKARVNFKKHVMPVLAGVLVMFAVVAGMNGQYLVAQWKYHFGHKMTVAAAPVTNAQAGHGAVQPNTASPNPERGPYLTLPAINTEAPIIFEPSTAEWKVQLALRNGVVHYGSSANPGQAGNTVIFGHSSGQPWAPGNYKFVFTLLDKLEKGQTITLDYQGTRYTYRVTDKYVVKPTDTSILAPSTKPTLTLFTCTPVGTSTNRLVIKAEQISPSPQNAPAAAPASGSTPTNLPS
jgi:LPXTG-site transpeptidase (sortase) family protein